MNETRTEFKVPQENFARLQERIEKLNRRAAKLGCAPVQFSVTGETFLTEWDRAIISNRTENSSVWSSDESEWPKFERHGMIKTGAKRLILNVSVVGQTPKYAGWTFAATLALSEGGTILRKSPGVEVELTQFRDAKPVCEHCQLERNRRDTFVLLHENGQFKQVGRNCLRDFLGHADPATLAAQAEWLMSVGEAFGESEDCEGGGYVEKFYNVTDFLENVAAVVLKSGFVSKKQSEERNTNPTSETAAMNMFPPPLWIKRGWVTAITPEAKELAKAAHEFILSISGELNDFQHNLLTVAKCEAVQSRQLGIAAYIVQHYRRAKEQSEKNAKLAADSKHWGEVKKRYKGQKLTFIGSNSFESQFGVGFFHRFASEDGACLIWKTGTSLNYAQGFTLTATFTVKEHVEFRGQKQTNISRLIAD